MEPSSSDPDDGLAPADGADGSWIVAQYDAIYSVGDRRNEVWVPLAPGHPWDREA